MPRLHGRILHKVLGEARLGLLFRAPSVMRGSSATPAGSGTEQALTCMKLEEPECEQWNPSSGACNAISEGTLCHYKSP